MRAQHNLTMATLAQIRTKAKAEAKLADFWALLQQKQNAYYAKNGKYFQLLVTPSNTVIDGVESDFSNQAPSDEKFVIDREFSFEEKIPFQIEVHEWTGKDGSGYKAFVYVQLLDGRIFSRNRDSNQIDSGWFEVTPEK